MSGGVRRPVPVPGTSTLALGGVPEILATPAVGLPFMVSGCRFRRRRAAAAVCTATELGEYHTPSATRPAHRQRPEAVTASGPTNLGSNGHAWAGGERVSSCGRAVHGRTQNLGGGHPRQNGRRPDNNDDRTVSIPRCEYNLAMRYPPFGHLEIPRNACWQDPCE